MALSAKINGVTYRCVNDYSIKEQSGAVSTTSINVLLGANPVPLMLQQVQLYIDGALFFAGLVQSVGTPEYSTTYETQVFRLSVSSLESLFNMRLVTKNFYYYTYPSWTSVLNYIFTNYIAEEGITLGGISTTAKTFDSKYSVQNKKLSDVLNEIANAIGNATWKITPDRKFYFLISSDFPSVAVPSKLSKVQLSESLGDLRTVQTVIGASNGINATASNDTLKATIAARTGGSGKIEIVETESSIHSDAKAATEAAARLTYYNEPIKEVSLLCHDLGASSLLNSWPLSLSIGGVAISGDFVVVERTISHQVGSKLNINVKLKNNNFFARYGYTLKGAALLASESQGAIGDQNADNRLTPLEKKSLLEEWDTIAGEKAGLDADGARYGLTSFVSAYGAAFQALADYLNDGTTWTTGTPLWLDGERMTQTEEIDYTVFVSLKVAYYNARSALTNAIRRGATTRLSVSTAAITRARDDSLTPSSVTMSATDETGAAYLGRFKVEVYTSSWATVYASAADESSYAYTVPATYGGAYISSVRVTLYAAGLGAKLGEALVTVALDSSTSAIYWGSFDDSGAWPVASQELGDYLWDNRTSSGGGGVIRYWDRAAWSVATIAWPGYTTAVKIAIDDIAAWVNVNGGTVAEVTAFMNAIIGNAIIKNGIIDFLATSVQVSTALCLDGVTRIAQIDWDNGVMTIRNPDQSLKATLDEAALTTEQVIDSNRTQFARIEGKALKIGDINPSTLAEKVVASIERDDFSDEQAVIRGKLTVPLFTGSSQVKVRLAMDTNRSISILYNSKIYLPSNGRNILEIYDVATDTVVTKTLPNSMARQTAQLHNGKIYMPQTAGTILEIYDIASGSTITKPLSQNMYRMTSLLYDGKIYMPQNGGTTLEIYDIASDSTIRKTLPTNMSRRTSQLYNGKIYMPQGTGGATLEIYDIASGTTVVKTLPTNMQRSTSQLCNGKIYMPGNGGTTLEIYNIETGSTATKTLPNNMNRATSILYSDMIYMPRSEGAIIEIYDTIKDTVVSKSFGISFEMFTCTLRNAIIYLPQNFGSGLGIYKIETRAQVGAGIIESGSNSNGSWIKYGDGTMIVHREITTLSGYTNNYPIGSLYYSFYYLSGQQWPVAFISPPSCSLNADENSLPTVECFHIYGIGTTTYVCEFGCLMASIRNPLSLGGISIIAIGRWKA